MSSNLLHFITVFERRNGLLIQTFPNNRRPERVAKSDERTSTRPRARRPRPSASFLAFFFAPNSKCIPFWQGQRSSLSPLPLSPSLPLSTCCRPTVPSVHPSYPIQPITAKQSLPRPQQQQINANPAARLTPLYALLNNGCLSDWRTDRPPLVFQSPHRTMVSEPLADFLNPLGAL